MHPAMRAGAAFRVNIAAGKFHGVSKAHTPTGFMRGGDGACFAANEATRNEGGMADRVKNFKTLKSSERSTSTRTTVLDINIRAQTAMYWSSSSSPLRIRQPFFLEQSTCCCCEKHAFHVVARAMHTSPTSFVTMRR